ncbi:MAG: hypothetical protein ACI9OU_001415 [Candidatus Promineifilaceae bacterium]|jgi:hypothetical protein
MKTDKIDTASIGDRTKVTDARIIERMNTIDYLDRGLQDSYAVAPTIQNQVQYRVREDKLERLPANQH